MKEFVEKLIERLEEKSFIMQCADNKFHNFINVDKIKNTINQLAEEYNQDSTKNNQGWIPVAERLPQEEENEGSLCIVVIVMLKNGIVTSGWCNRYLKKWYVLDYCSDYPIPHEYEDVIAWMPLPEPYKECEIKQGLDKVRQEPKTRIEHIRSMSVEELADAILERSEISTAIDFCQNFCGECENIPESECRKCLIQWLNSPVEQKKTIPTKHFNERFNKVI